MANWGDAPRILIFGDNDGGRSAASDAALAQGGRVVGAIPIEGAIERLDNQISTDLVIVDIIEDHGAMLDRLLRYIEDGASARHFAAIVVIPPELLDIAVGRLDEVTVVVGRDPDALAAAIAESLDRTAPQLREPDGRGQASRLHYAALAEMGGGSAAEDAQPADDAASLAAVPDAATIRGLIRARRLRGQFFGPGLFADPAWDILLDLTAARIEGHSVAVSSLCIAAAVPATTALRWIKQLTEAGLLRRVADPVDGRRIFIELTDEAAATMIAYFGALERGGKA